MSTVDLHFLIYSADMDGAEDNMKRLYQTAHIVS